MIMRRKLFLLAVAAAALASCSSDETVSVNQGLEDANSISFRPAIQGMTRAANGTGLKSTWENGDILYVTAMRGTSKYFQDQFVRDNTGFRSKDKHFWPNDIGTNNITFTAFWGAEYKSYALTNDENKLGAAYTVPDAVANQKDLLFAKTAALSSKPNQDGHVLLNFRHMLSQICVKVANDQANLAINITGVRVGYVAKTGTFDYSGSETDTRETGSDNASKIARTCWTPTAPTVATQCYDQAVTASLSGVQTATALSGFSSWILMPQALTAASEYKTANNPAGSVAADPDLNGAYLALQMTIIDKATSAPIVNSQWCYWPIGTEWKPGYKYTYTINAGSGGYQPTDQNNVKTDLDPVLGGTVIWFDPACTIDAWVEDNTGVSEPAVAVTDKTTAGTPLSYTVAAGTHGTYTIVVTGLTAGNTVTVAGTNNFNISAPTVTPATVGAEGRVVITGTLSANKDAGVTSVITLTEKTAGDVEATTTTITVIGETIPAATAASPKTNAPTILTAVPIELGSLISLSLNISNVMLKIRISIAVGNGTPCLCVFRETNNLSGIIS